MFVDPPLEANLVVTLAKITIGEDTVDAETPKSGR